MKEEDTHSIHNYIFYTPEGFCIAPNGENVENLQVLGMAGGMTEKEAFENLLMENEWINQMGFSHNEVKSRELA